MIGAETLAIMQSHHGDMEGNKQFSNANDNDAAASGQPNGESPSADRFIPIELTENAPHFVNSTPLPSQQSIMDPNESSSITHAAQILNSIPLLSSQLQLKRSSQSEQNVCETEKPVKRGRRTKQLARPRKLPRRPSSPLSDEEIEGNKGVIALHRKGDKGALQTNHGVDQMRQQPDSLLDGNRNVCVALEEPLPENSVNESQAALSAGPLPEFTELANYSSTTLFEKWGHLAEGLRGCVMCGKVRTYSSGNKGIRIRTSESNYATGVDENVVIPLQNKGVCTACDVRVWVIGTTGLQIKWCKGCKNFRPWAAFGEKGSATKCLGCRERAKMRYAKQKSGSKS
ncbi:hypothetical protein MPSEU_000972200 [Mayamaea pseudoterrestris]|nr:hypothetical protein MPSEU_000972200 [Mayamaea pseudoterrestris]